MRKIINIPINFDILKVIALLTMTFDHIGRILTPSFEAYLRLIGRVSFPIFVFLMVFNLSQKDLFKKYISRLLSFALISSLTLFHFKNTLNDLLPLNILWTLLLGVVTIYSINKANLGFTNKFFKYCAFAYIIIFSLTLSLIIDYKYYGLFYILSMYAYFKNKHPTFALFSIILSYLINIDISTSASIISAISTFILLLTIKQSEKHKRFIKPWWLFYAYYPTHLIVLYTIKIYW